MARGWDDGGAFVDLATSRLICGGNAGCGGGAGDCLDALGGTGKTGFRPNVLVGHCPLDTTPPEIAFGLNDVSLEYWHCWKVYSTDGTIYSFDMTGLVRMPTPFTSDPALAMYCNWGGIFDPWMISGDFDPDRVVPGGATGTLRAVPGGWSHVAANADRSGNMTVYVNAQLVDTFAINALAAENNNNDPGRLYARVAGDSGAGGPGAVAPTRYNGTLEDVTTYHHSRYMVGPIALHRRLMTAAEIRESYRGKRVQNFGAAGTYACWYWQDVERPDLDAVCWDFVEDHTHHATLIGVVGRGIGMPVGAAGTIRVPDLSGSGNHWVLPTLGSYQRTATCDELSSTAFLYDPFWTS